VSFRLLKKDADLAEQAGIKETISCSAGQMNDA
jgi:hypothetical protein